MKTNVPYMASNKNLHGILAAMQKAAVPDVFSNSFLQDMGFTSSNDRPITGVLRFLGLLDDSNRPTTAYREFVDDKRSKQVLARQIARGYDDLFKSKPNASQMPVGDLKGWFKTKTGESDAVAQKLASTFRSLCDWSDFSGLDTAAATAEPEEVIEVATGTPTEQPARSNGFRGTESIDGNGFGLVFRIEIHLPETQNIETYRAIFRALREELT